ncbi:MAG TPA: arsenate reductase ArsC [Armatimonadota bacterium]|jgi:protein-tyrosine-phosphatase
MQIMFVCVHNAGRSQMAEAFFNALTPAGMHAISTGTQPTERVNPVVVAAMAEVGIDLRAQHPQLATPELVDASDRIITMGCGVQESCPVYLGMKIDEDWGLSDPAGQGLDAVRPIRDAVRERVLDLIARLQNSTKGESDVY